MRLAPPVGLRLQQLQVSGRNGFQLGPINTTIEPGHFVGLFGTAQSGKSLLLSSLCDLVPHRGEKKFLGHEGPSQPNIQLIFQEGGLLEECTVQANLSLAQEAFGGRAPKAQKELLERLGIPEAASLLPRNLSGGMRKRVLLARALLCAPQILLVDHVTAGLDPRNAANLLELVFELKRERNFTLVWVTHEPELMMTHLDQLLILESGQVVFDGERETANGADALNRYLRS